jgi:hypothetical protein
LVKAAGLRTGFALQFGCYYYHSSVGGDRAVREYTQRVWDATRDPFAGELLACALLRSGDREGTQAVLSSTLQRRGARSNGEWILWACVQGDDGQREAVYREARAQPRTLGLSVVALPSVALLLGKPEESRALYAEALAGGLVPRWHHGWYEELAGYGASAGGPEVEKVLLQRAGRSRMQRCEAHFYLALHHLGRGNKGRAHRHFEDAVRTRVFHYNEHCWASVFLARMRAERNWPSWIEAAR